MRDIVDLTAQHLARVDPAGASTYERNALAYQDALDQLDAEYARDLASCERRELFTAHDAFGHLAQRYDLDQRSIAGVSPDEEPTPDRIADLADEARDAGATTIFTEPLVPADLSETLAREAGDLDTASLDPLESLTEDKVEAGEDYVSVMRENLATLRVALGCG
jgi:zinc transport system substrate-binding protein